MWWTELSCEAEGTAGGRPAWKRERNFYAECVSCIFRYVLAGIVALAGVGLLCLIRFYAGWLLPDFGDAAGFVVTHVRGLEVATMLAILVGGGSALIARSRLVRIAAPLAVVLVFLIGAVALITVGLLALVQLSSYAAPSAP